MRRVPSPAGAPGSGGGRLVAACSLARQEAGKAGAGARRGWLLYSAWPEVGGRRDMEDGGGSSRSARRREQGREQRGAQCHASAVPAPCQRHVGTQCHPSAMSGRGGAAWHSMPCQCHASAMSAPCQCHVGGRGGPHGTQCHVSAMLGAAQVRQAGRRADRQAGRQAGLVVRTSRKRGEPGLPYFFVCKRGCCRFSFTCRLSHSRPHAPVRAGLTCRTRAAGLELPGAWLVASPALGWLLC